MGNVKSSVNVKIDSNVKELASQLLERMGLDQTTAIDMFFRQIIAERRLPFQPIVNMTLDEQIIAVALKNNPTRVALQTDKDGNILINEETNPAVFDWVVNG